MTSLVFFQILAIETAAHIGMTSEGRKEIREIGSQTVEPIRKILDRGIDNEKVRVLSAFGDLVNYTSTNLKILPVQK